MKKLMAMLLVMLLCASMACAESVIQPLTTTVPEGWQFCSLGYTGLTMRLPVDFVTDELDDGDDQLLGSWTNQGMTITALLVNSSLSEVEKTLENHLGTDFFAISALQINGMNYLMTDTVDGVITYAYVAYTENSCLCLMTSRNVAEYEMDFALLDVLGSIGGGN